MTFVCVVIRKACQKILIAAAAHSISPNCPPQQSAMKQQSGGHVFDLRVASDGDDRSTESACSSSTGARYDACSFHKRNAALFTSTHHHNRRGLPRTRSGYQPSPRLASSSSTSSRVRGRPRSNVGHAQHAFRLRVNSMGSVEGGACMTTCHPYHCLLVTLPACITSLGCHSIRRSPGLQHTQPISGTV